MTPFIGQTVRVHFLGTTDANLPTTFRIDDVSLLATVPTTSQITVGPSSQTFGNVAVGSCGTGAIVIQHVNGTAPASGTVSVSPNPPFSFTSGNTFSVANGSAANIGIQFCPTSTGNFSGSATVSSSGTTIGGTNPVALSGTGVQNPILNVLDNSLGFGTINVGSSADQAFTIRNDGGGTLTGSVVSVSPNPPFSLVGGGSFTLGAGQGQQVTIRFTPQSAGSFTGNVSVSSNGGSDNVSLVGTGQIVGPTDTIAIIAGPTATPNPVSSGGQVQVSVSASDSLGHSLGYAWTGSGGNFSNPSSASTTWTAPPNTTGTTQSYTLSVTVTDLQGSAAYQTRSLTVQVSPSSAPQVTLGPTSLNFGDVQVGSCTTGFFAVQHVLGTGPASGTVSAGPNPPFSIASNSSFNVSNGSAVNVGVQFCPTSANNGVAFSGSATVSSPGTTFTNTNTVSLTGRGINPIGAIQVKAKLNGVDWSGALNYTLTGPVTINGTSVPADFQQRPPGLYTFNYTSDGPSGASLASITPAATQTLNTGGLITFTLNFTAADTVTITSGPSGTPNPVASGGTVNLSVIATDSLNHQLSYNWLGVCNGLPSNGSFSDLNAQNPVWTAPTNTTGSAKTCTLTVTASDGLGHSDTKSFTETVNSTGQPTVAWSTPPPSSVTSGQPFSVAWSISGGSPSHVNVHWDPTNPGGPGNPSGNINPSCQQSSTSCSTNSPTSSPAPLTAPTVSTSTVVRYLVHATVNGTDIFTDTRDVTVNPVPVTTGTLNVTTTPVNGDIFVDGALRGNGSISIQLAAGIYTVSFGDVSGYATPSPRSVTITANETMVITVAYDLIVLEKVNLLSPSNDATGVSITPTFVWSGVNGANRYWLMVATSPSDFPTDPNAASCPNCVISGRTGSTSHALPHAFPFGGKSGTLSVNAIYYWKVQAWDYTAPLEK